LPNPASAANRPDAATAAKSQAINDPALCVAGISDWIGNELRVSNWSTVRHRQRELALVVTEVHR
jgi:hypothetical protein